MIMIVDDYILLFTSLGAILWGLARYLFTLKVTLPGAPNASRLKLVWAVVSGLILIIGAVVMLAVVKLGTTTPYSDWVAWTAAGIYALGAFLLPGKGYRPGLVKLDKAILILLAVLLLTGSLYDNFAR